jgi:hypothetical protein
MRPTARYGKRTTQASETWYQQLTAACGTPQTRDVLAAALIPPSPPATVHPTLANDCIAGKQFAMTRCANDHTDEPMRRRGNSKWAVEISSQDRLSREALG